MDQDDKFEAWAIVDLFGHQRVAGRVTEQTIGGCSFVRVDIPRATGEVEARLYGQGAIYGITLVAEEVARAFGAETPAPFGEYTFPSKVRELLEGTRDDVDEDEQAGLPF